MAETKVVSGVPTGATFGVPGTEMLVDPSFGAARVNVKPTEFMSQGTVGGHFVAAAVTGAFTGVAAAGIVFSFRWAPTNGMFAIIKRIQVGAAVTTAFSTAQSLAYSLLRITGFTASDSSGTAVAPFAVGTNKMRTALMSGSQVTDFRIATTGALSAGTGTADAQPMGYNVGAATAIGTVCPVADLYNEASFGQHPLMLAQNEGFRILNVIAMGSTGVVNVFVNVTWAEVPGY